MCRSPPNLACALPSRLSDLLLGAGGRHPSVTHGGAGEDRVFGGFHDHSMGWASSARRGLVLPQLLADAGHRCLGTVLRVRRVGPVVPMAGGHSKADHAGGRLRGRGGQPVPSVGRRHLVRGRPFKTCTQLFTCSPCSKFSVAESSPPPSLSLCLHPASPSPPATLRRTQGLIAPVTPVHLGWKMPH